MSKETFIQRVTKCRHKNLSETYLKTWSCATPYCEAEESHCLDCGMFIIVCGCGCENGLSGWSYSRRLVYDRKHKLPSPA